MHACTSDIYIGAGMSTTPAVERCRTTRRMLVQPVTQHAGKKFTRQVFINSCIYSAIPLPHVHRSTIAEQLQNNLGIYVSIFLLFFFIDRLLVHKGLVRHTAGLTETQMKSIADRHAGFLPVPFLAWEKLLC